MNSKARRPHRWRMRGGGLVLLAVSAVVVAWSSAGPAASGSSANGAVPSVAETPLLAVVGASFSAGVGARHVRSSWPQDLARALRWRLVVSADPGAGFVNRGAKDLGPFANLTAELHLARQEPDVILIQGGHNDMRQPPALVRLRVESLVRSIRHQLPDAMLGVITVFATAHYTSPAAWATDKAIVAAAKSVDPKVMIFDPLASHWSFPRTHDQFHPSPAGHLWIADRIATALHRYGAVAGTPDTDVWPHPVVTPRTAVNSKHSSAKFAFPSLSRT